MSKLYSTLAVRTCDERQVIRCLQSALGVHFQESTSEFTYGFFLNVNEAPSEWLHGVDSLGEALPEIEPFYQEVDVSTFRTHVDMFCNRGHIMAEYLHVFADATGKIISEAMQESVLVFFDGTNVPYCRYENGKKTKSFVEYSEEYVKLLSWVPRIK